MKKLLKLLKFREQPKSLLRNTLKTFFLSFINGTNTTLFTPFKLIVSLEFGRTRR